VDDVNAFSVAGWRTSIAEREDRQQLPAARMFDTHWMGGSSRRKRQLLDLAGGSSGVKFKQSGQVTSSVLRSI
jgi:hypothetical protein